MNKFQKEKNSYTMSECLFFQYKIKLIEIV